MVKLRPYVVATNHVPGCSKRRCGPGCERKTNGWEADVIVRLADGTALRERVKVPVTGRAAASRWAQEREAFLIREGGKKKEAVRAEVPTLEEFWPRFIEGHSKANREKPSSIRSKQSVYENHLGPRFASRRLNEIGDEDVQQLKAGLRDRTVKTTNNVLTVLNTLLKAAVEWGVMDRLPCRIRLLKTSVPTVRFYEPEVYEGLVEAAAKEDPRVHLAVLLGGDAGLRLGEIIALEWPDVDFRRGLLLVRRSEWQGEVTLPKGGRERRVPMTRRLTEALRVHRHLRSLRVLVQDDGSGVNRAWLWYAMKRVQRRAGMAPDGRFHVLRHTFCSRLAMKNVPAMSIKELAGHQNLQTTQRYLHLSAGAMEAAIRVLEQERSTGSDVGDVVETDPKSRLIT